MVASVAGALLVLKPKTAIPLLAISFVIGSLVVAPAATALATGEQTALETRTVALDDARTSLILSNQTAQAEQLTPALLAAREQSTTAATGIETEQKTPKDQLSHLFGVLTGVGFALFLYPKSREEWKKRFLKFLKNGI